MHSDLVPGPSQHQLLNLLWWHLIQISASVGKTGAYGTEDVCKKIGHVKLHQANQRLQIGNSHVKTQEIPLYKY